MDRHVIPQLYSSNTIGVTSADMTRSYFRCTFVKVNAVDIRGLSECARIAQQCDLL